MNALRSMNSIGHKTMLEVRELCVEYSGQQVLQNVNLKMNYGEIVSIVGESGSGKTTLMKSIAGILPRSGVVTNGSIVFDGRPVDKQVLKNGKLTYVFQNPGAYFDPIKRIKSQFAAYLKRHKGLNGQEAYKVAETWLTSLNFENPKGALTAYPHQLSGGMKQRMALAFALSVDPLLVIADEPTSALDVLTQRQVIQEIKSLRDRFNTGFLVVTHNIGCAASLSDRIVVMKKGEIIESGTPIEIINRPKEEYTKILIQSVPILKGVNYETRACFRGDTSY